MPPTAAVWPVATALLGRMNRIPFAERVSDGALVLPREVPRGLAARCLCPECGLPVLARKGRVVRHHFAHFAATRCTGESALHAALVRAVAASCRERGLAAETEWCCRVGGSDRRFDVAVLRQDGRLRLAYEVAVTNRKTTEFVRAVHAAGVRVREAWVDLEVAGEVMASATTWNDAVSRILASLVFLDLWDARGLAICSVCGRRAPGARSCFCRRCRRARTCAECGGRKRPGYSTCYACAWGCG